MKFTANRTQLIDAIQRVQGAVSTRTPNPALKGVLMVAEEGEWLRLEAVNDLVEMAYTMNGVAVAKSGRAVMWPGRVLEVLKTARDEEVKVEAKRGGVASRRSTHLMESPTAETLVRFWFQGGKNEVPGFPVDDFSPVDLRPPVHPATMMAHRFADSLERVIFAARKPPTDGDAESSKVDDGYAMETVLVHIGEQTIHVVATDLRHIAVAECPLVEKQPESVSAMIPTQSARTLASALRNAGETDMVQLSVTPLRLVCQVGDSTLIRLRLAEGKYAPWQQAVGQVQVDAAMEVELAPLAANLRMCAAVSDPKQPWVKIRVSRDGRSIQGSVKSELGQGEFALSGPGWMTPPERDVEIGVDCRYLARVLSQARTESARVEFRKNRRAILVRKDGEYLYAVALVV